MLAVLLPCPLYQITGLQCPFCGVQRAVVLALHGEWGEAFRLNPFFWLTVPYLLLLLLGAVRATGVGEWKLYRWAQRDRVLFGYALLMLLWAVWRNLC